MLLESGVSIMVMLENQPVAWTEIYMEYTRERGGCPGNILVNIR